MSIADTGGGSLVDGGGGCGRGSLDRRKYAGVDAAMRSAARKSKSNDFLDRLDGGTGRQAPSSCPIWPYLIVCSTKLRPPLPLSLPASVARITNQIHRFLDSAHLTSINPVLVWQLHAGRVTFALPPSGDKLVLPLHKCTRTDMQEKAKARLRELAHTSRGNQEAGFTQPSLRLLMHVCTRSSKVLSLSVSESRSLI